MAKRYSGNLQISVIYDDKGHYRTAVSRGGKLLWRGIVNPAAAGFGPGVAYDSPRAYDEVASSALAFGNHDVDVIGDEAEHNEAMNGYLIRRTPRKTSKSTATRHATKKSPAQLQREVDEVLANPGAYSYEEAMEALAKKHVGVKRGGSLRAGHAPVVPERSPWRTRVFNTHHAAQSFLKRIKKKHVAVIEAHGASQWHVAYLPEGEGLPRNA